MVPESLYYTKDHEWVRVEGGEGVVGITAHAQQELGDIVFVELPEVGRKLSGGDEFGTVESVKAVAEVYAPLGGEVIAVNKELVDTPERCATVNADPYGQGWLIRLRLSAPAEAGGLMNAAQYEQYLAQAKH
jgi:glycine cleavage system H protein